MEVNCLGDTATTEQNMLKERDIIFRNIDQQKTKRTIQ
jgi:hypothetical protein